MNATILVMNDILNRRTVKISLSQPAITHILYRWSSSTLHERPVRFIEIPAIYQQGEIMVRHLLIQLFIFGIFLVPAAYSEPSLQLITGVKKSVFEVIVPKPSDETRGVGCGKGC